MEILAEIPANNNPSINGGTSYDKDGNVIIGEIVKGRCTGIYGAEKRGSYA